MSISIKKAQYIKEYIIELTFSDGTIQVIDLKTFLENSSSSVTRQYLSLENFKDFHIEFGDLVWHDYGLCFPIIDLYENIFSKKILVVA